MRRFLMRLLRGSGGDARDPRALAMDRLVDASAFWFDSFRA
jgi:hypothetical protein